jgi:hypothetical protein
MHYHSKRVKILLPDSKWDPDRQIYYHTARVVSKDDSNHGIQGSTESLGLGNSSDEGRSKSTLESCVPPSKQHCDENPTCKSSFADQRIQIDFLHIHDAVATTPLRSNTNKERIRQQRGNQTEEPGDVAHEADCTTHFFSSTGKGKSSEQYSLRTEQNNISQPDRAAHSTDASAPPFSSNDREKERNIKHEEPGVANQHAHATKPLFAETNQEKMSKSRTSQRVKRRRVPMQKQAHPYTKQFPGGPNLFNDSDLQRSITAPYASWIPSPKVHVDRLTYDWSPLKLDGTVAWSAWRQEWLFQNATTLEHTEPSTAALDMFRFVTALKQEVVQTVGPTPASPMIKTLPLMSSWRLWNRQGDRRFKKAKTGAASEETDISMDWVQRCTSLLSPLLPSFCTDEDLGPLIPRAAAVYYEMFSHQGSTIQHRDERIKKYQYMTVEELQVYVREMERDVSVTLVEKERRILRTAEQLRLYPLEKPEADRVSRATDSDCLPPPPRVLPQDDFSSLFKKVPSRRKRKRYIA